MRTFYRLAVLALSFLPVAALGATLLSENFDELTPGAAITSVGAFSAIDGTNIDIVGSLNGSFDPSICAAPESGNCVDMDGSGGNPQGILQSNASFTLVPGTNYYLSFQLVGSRRGTSASTTVTFGPYSQTFNLASADVTSGIVVNQLVTVATTTVTNLTFTSNTPGIQGNLLDNVLITSAPASPSPTPAPPTWLLSVIGLMAAALILMRRRTISA
jgi:hypothetical protein